MSKEVVFVLEPDAGRVTVEISQASKEAVNDLAHDLGGRANLNCASPVRKERYLPVMRAESEVAHPGSDFLSIWLYRLYHNSVVDGPGRRSVIQTAGCSIRCKNCLVPQTWHVQNGMRVPISTIVEDVLARRHDHDGVTILGGEPFDQPESVAELVSGLKHHGIHIVLYSGFTIEQLIQRKLPAIDYTLAHIDLLIDGPFISEKREGASEYRGSRNQRLIGR
jgi:anaerobic ribonucleoside-triphosphate reductase activating protein